MAAVGIDACKTGWVAVVLRPGERAEAHHLASIDVLRAAVPDVEVVAIDIPIGLPVSGRRAADLEARAALGARRSSLFITPVRESLVAATHLAATTTSVRLTGSGISQQSFALAPKIFEVEAWLHLAPCPVFEVHPELAFTVMIGAPPTASKKTWAGMIERRTALAAVGIVLDHVGGDASKRAAVDDMLDAAAAAWSATRLLDWTARSFPDPPEVGPDGRPMAIWA